MKDDSIYIEHIHSSIQRIKSYTACINKESFLNNHLIQDAVVRQLEIIGEATKKISSDLRNQNPTIPWIDMAAMRDKLIHDYIDVDFEIVWTTVAEDIPKLEDLLSNL